MPDPVVLQQRLKGKGPWLTARSSASAIGAGVISPYYATVTLAFPGNTGMRYLGLALVLITITSVLGTLLTQSQLRTLRGLGSGTLSGTREELLAAVREVALSPDRNFTTSLWSWALIPLVSGLIFKGITPEASWALVLRISLLGVVFGPIASVLVYFLCTLRSRPLVAELAALGGLETHELARVIPNRRDGLRRRFVVYTGMGFLTPCVVTADVALTLGHRRWVRVLAEVDPDAQAKLAHALTTQQTLQVLLLAGMSIGLALVAAWVAGQSLGEPLQQISLEASRMAAGDLGEGQVVLAEDDTWVVSTSFAAMRVYLVDVLRELARAGEEISESSRQLVGTTSGQQEGSSRQAAALNQTSATTGSLAKSAEQTAQSAQKVSDLAAKSLATASSGQQGVQTFQNAVVRIRADNEATSKAVETLKGKVQQIGRIVEFIRELADKSDLLAVNAELEGTRAGEVGRGFSLVATELRRLAESVLGATHEIEQRIDEIRAATQDAVEATHVSVRATEIGADLAKEMSESFRWVLELAQRTSEASHAISLGTQQQQQGVAQLAEAMGDILRGTEESGAVTAQMSAATQDLAGLSRTLGEAVSGFQLGSGGKRG